MNIKELQTITHDTLKEVRNFDVVTPDFFANTFYAKATEIDTNLDRDMIARESSESILDKILKIQKETKAQTNELKENIDLASIAIEANDNKSLGEVKNNIDELYQRILHLEEQVYLDELTKVQNRKWLFENVLDNNIFKRDGSLTFLDIDKFKIVNDTYGHIAGDKVLVMIAQLTTRLVDSKTVRYGGDEFIVISDTSDSLVQKKFFETINNNLSKKDLTYQGNSFKVGISFGSIDYKKGDNFQKVIETADKMMYHHKKSKVECVSSPY